MPKYKIIVYRSNEDQVLIAEVPELPRAGRPCYELLVGRMQARQRRLPRRSQEGTRGIFEVPVVL